MLPYHLLFWKGSKLNDILFMIQFTCSARTTWTCLYNLIVGVTMRIICWLTPGPRRQVLFLFFFLPRSTNYIKKTKCRNCEINQIPKAMDLSADQRAPLELDDPVRSHRLTCLNFSPVTASRGLYQSAYSWPGHGTTLGANITVKAESRHHLLLSNTVQA